MTDKRVEITEALRRKVAERTAQNQQFALEFFRVAEQQASAAVVALRKIGLHSVADVGERELSEIRRRRRDLEGGRP